MNAADWGKPESHRTTVERREGRRLELARSLDQDRYSVAMGWSGAAELLEPTRPHEFALRGSGNFSFTVGFSREGRKAAATISESRASPKEWAVRWEPRA